MAENPFAAKSTLTKEVPDGGKHPLPPWLTKGKKKGKHAKEVSKDDKMAAIRARMASKKGK